MPTKSYLSQSELPLHLGVGRGRVTEATVRWPDGRESSFEPRLDQTSTIRQ